MGQIFCGKFNMASVILYKVMVINIIEFHLHTCHINELKMIITKINKNKEQSAVIMELVKSQKVGFFEKTNLRTS